MLRLGNLHFSKQNQKRPAVHAPRPPPPHALHIYPRAHHRCHNLHLQRSRYRYGCSRWHFSSAGLGPIDWDRHDWLMDLTQHNIAAMGSSTFTRRTPHARCRPRAYELQSRQSERWTLCPEPEPFDMIMGNGKNASGIDMRFTTTGSVHVCLCASVLCGKVILGEHLLEHGEDVARAQQTGTMAMATVMDWWIRIGMMKLLLRIIAELSGRGSPRLSSGTRSSSVTSRTPRASARPRTWRGGQRQDMFVASLVGMYTQGSTRSGVAN